MAGGRSTSELDPFFDELAAWAEAAGSRPRTISYGNDPSQQLDLRLPNGDAPHRLAIVLHGGFWRAPYTRRIMDAAAAALTAQSWATANIEYRRLGPGAYEAMFTDVAAARACLERLDAPLDLTRVIAVGHSAGGHLALWLAARGGANAVLGLAAVCDLVDAAREELGGRATQELLGGEPAEAAGAYASADPAQLLPLGVPQVLAHGTDDDRVPLAHAERYAERARRAGDECSVLALAGADHFDVIDPRTDAWRRIAAAIPG